MILSNQKNINNISLNFEFKISKITASLEIKNNIFKLFIIDFNFFMSFSVETFFINLYLSDISIQLFDNDCLKECNSN